MQACLLLFVSVVLIGETAGSVLLVALNIQLFKILFFFILPIYIACTAADDFTGVSGDCTKFYRCASGTLFQMSCGPGTNFDYLRKICDYPAQAACLGGAAVTS